VTVSVVNIVGNDSNASNPSTSPLSGVSSLNFLLLSVWQNGGGAISLPTDNASPHYTWTQVIQRAPAANNINAAIFLGVGGPGGSVTVSVAGANALGATLAEIHGAGTNPTIAATSTTQANASGNFTGPLTVPVSNGDLIWQFAGADNFFLNNFAQPPWTSDPFPTDGSHNAAWAAYNNTTVGGVGQQATWAITSGTANLVTFGLAISLPIPPYAPLGFRQPYTQAVRRAALYMRRAGGLLAPEHAGERLVVPRLVLGR